MMRLCVFALAVIAAPHAPVPVSSEASPVLFGRIQPLAKFVDDAATLAEKFGKADAGKAIDAKIAHALGLDSLKSSGLDLQKPLGFYAFVGDDVKKSTVVAMLPVVDRKAVLDLVGQYQIKAVSLGDDLYSLDIPEETLPVFVRFADGYAYVTAPDKAAIARDRILPPAKVFAANETAWFTMTARPEATTEAFRTSVMDQLRLLLKQWRDDDDGPLPEGPFVAAQLKNYERWLELFLQGGKQLDLRVEFDRPSGELAFDMTMAPRTGTALADKIASLKPGRSLFTKLVGDAGAINLAANTHLGDELSKDLGKLLREIKDGLIDWLAPDLEKELKDQLREVFKSLAPAAEAGELDAAASLRGPGAGTYQLLFGIRVKEGRKVEAELRKLVAELPEETRKGLKLDALTVGAAKVHEISTAKADAFDTNVFGRNTAHFALSDDVLLVGLGKGAGETVGELLNGALPQPAPAVRCDLSIKRLKEFADTFGAYDWIKGMFGKDADRIRLFHVTMDGGEKLKARATVSLQAFGGAMYFAGIE
jgi:hypothetical protein